MSTQKPSWRVGGRVEISRESKPEIDCLCNVRNITWDFPLLMLQDYFKPPIESNEVPRKSCESSDVQHFCMLRSWSSFAFATFSMNRYRKIRATIHYPFCGLPTSFFLLLKWLIAMLVYDAKERLTFGGQWSNLHIFIGRFCREIDNLRQEPLRLLNRQDCSSHSAVDGPPKEALLTTRADCAKERKSPNKAIKTITRAERLSFLRVLFKALLRFS